MTPDHDYLLWVATAAYAAHILEEFNYDWRTWAEKNMGLSVGWNSFYIINAAVIVLGVCCAQVGWRLPEFSLAFPALMVINGVFFHILPTLVQRRYSPGTFTSVVLFLPLCTRIYQGASRDGVLSVRAVAVSCVAGVLIMAFPVVLQTTKGLKMFQND